MKLLLRSLFIGMLVAAVAAQASRLGSPDSEHDDKARLVDALATLGLHAAPANAPAVLTAMAPGCPEPVVVATITFDGDDSHTLRALLATAGVTRYVYLGYVGSSVSPIAVGGRWAVASALGTFGLRRTHIPHEVIVAMIPKACPQLADLDWSVLSPWP
jgi:hypothetical protein